MWVTKFLDSILPLLSILVIRNRHQRSFVSIPYSDLCWKYNLIKEKSFCDDAAFFESLPAMAGCETEFSNINWEYWPPLWNILEGRRQCIKQNRIKPIEAYIEHQKVQLLEGDTYSNRVRPHHRRKWQTWMINQQKE